MKISPWFRVGSVDGLVLPVRGDGIVAGSTLLTVSPGRGNVHNGKGHGASHHAPLFFCRSGKHPIATRGNN